MRNWWMGLRDSTTQERALGSLLLLGSMLMLVALTGLLLS